jgi:hypothetical protein
LQCFQRLIDLVLQELSWVSLILFSQLMQFL